MAFVPFSPLARGLLTNTLDVTGLEKGDFRSALPRYQADHAENNRHLSEGIALIAREHECTPSQLALAWVLSRGAHIIPIPGTKKRKYLRENAAAVDVTISPGALRRIEDLLARYPDTGSRYSASQERLVDRSLRAAVRFR